jgi:hypothetical protein
MIGQNAAFSHAVMKTEANVYQKRAVIAVTMDE